jgi:hypothetical protein
MAKQPSFTKVSKIPSWMLDTPKSVKAEKPKPRGPELRIETKVSDLDTVPVGADVTLICKGVLTMRRIEENADKTARDIYEIEVMQVAVSKSQKDLMKEVI